MAETLMISKSYLVGIASGRVRPGLKLAKEIEWYTSSIVKADDLRSVETLKSRCPHCGQYSRKVQK